VYPSNPLQFLVKEEFPRKDLFSFLSLAFLPHKQTRKANKKKTLRGKSSSFTWYSMAFGVQIIPGGERRKKDQAGFM